MKVSIVTYNIPWIGLPWKGWAFDSIYWKFLDERFFGDRPNDIVQED